MVDVVRRRWPVLFAVFVLALSLPFWRFGGGASGWQAGCPAIAAVLLLGWAEGRAGLRRLLRRLVDFSGIRPRWWLVPAVVTAPLVVLASHWMLGRPVAEVSVASIPLSCCVFLIGAVGEEVGWSGYLTDPTVRRFGMPGGGVVVGVFWAAWHIPGWYVRAGHSLVWIAGEFLLMVALRVIIVWLYERAGKCLAVAILFNAAINVSEFLFPNNGSRFDPVVAGLVASVIAAALIVFDRTRWHAGAEMTRRP